MMITIPNYRSKFTPYSFSIPIISNNYSTFILIIQVIYEERQH